MNVTCFSGGRNPCFQSLFRDIAIDFFPLRWGPGMAPEVASAACRSPGSDLSRLLCSLMRSCWGRVTPPHEGWHPYFWSQLNSNCKKHPTKSCHVGNRVVWAPVAIATTAKKGLGKPGLEFSRMWHCLQAALLGRWKETREPLVTPHSPPAERDQCPDLRIPPVSHTSFQFHWAHYAVKSRSATFSTDVFLPYLQ